MLVKTWTCLAYSHQHKMSCVRLVEEAVLKTVWSYGFGVQIPGTTLQNRHFMGGFAKVRNGELIMLEKMENKNMVGIRLYDGKTIDTSSAEMKEKVSKAVAEYVINNWDDVAKVEREGQDVLVYVTL